MANREKQNLRYVKPYKKLNKKKIQRTHWWTKEVY